MMPTKQNLVIYCQGTAWWLRDTHARYYSFHHTIPPYFYCILCWLAVCSK